MLPTTLQAVRSILTADPSVNPPERNRLLAILRQGPQPQAAPAAAASTGPRIMLRGEVAERLSRSLRTVDKYAATGLLKKRTFPGHRRASGFLATDVEALLTGELGAA